MVNPILQKPLYPLIIMGFSGFDTWVVAGMSPLFPLSNTAEKCFRNYLSSPVCFYVHVSTVFISAEAKPYNVLHLKILFKHCLMQQKRGI